jgi:hypothetical protein
MLTALICVTPTMSAPVGAEQLSPPEQLDTREDSQKEQDQVNPSGGGSHDDALVATMRAELTF